MLDTRKSKIAPPRARTPPFGISQHRTCPDGAPRCLTARLSVRRISAPKQPLVLRALSVYAVASRHAGYINRSVWPLHQYPLAIASIPSGVFSQASAGRSRSSNHSGLVLPFQETISSPAKKVCNLFDSSTAFRVAVA